MNAGRVLLSLLAIWPVSARAAPCTGTLCNADQLAPVFARLAATRAGNGERPVHILQIGDSHTAGDVLTGGWRDLLQARYGVGGRGVLAAGRPYQGYLTRGVTAAMSPGWRVSPYYGAGSAAPRPLIGVSGFSLTSTVLGASLGLTADTAGAGGQGFDRVVLCGIAEPRAGRLTVRIGGATSLFDLGSATRRPECRSFALDRVNSALSVTADGGPVTITSWATFHDDGGVVLSNVGVVGSQLVHFARTDDAVLAEEFRSYRPDMIVLAFGTNEGFTPGFNPFGYEVTLRTQIGRLRRLAGDVPILLLGAPDASSRQPMLRSNAPGPAVACTGAAVARPAPLPNPSTSGLDATIAGLAADARAQGFAPDPTPEVAPPAALPAARPPPPGLFTPPGIAAVRAIQRRIAGELNVAFWDWGARMGGACSAPDWVRRSPPLMRGDHVHFTSAGGRELARRLQADLDAAGMPPR